MEVRLSAFAQLGGRAARRRTLAARLPQGGQRGGRAEAAEADTASARCPAAELSEGTEPDLHEIFGTPGGRRRSRPAPLVPGAHPLLAGDSKNLGRPDPRPSRKKLREKKHTAQLWPAQWQSARCHFFGEVEHTVWPQNGSSSDSGFARTTRLYSCSSTWPRTAL